MTPRQFSALSGVKYETVIEWIKAGKLLAVPVGNRYLIAESEYRRYMSEGLVFNVLELQEAKKRRHNNSVRKDEMKRLQEESRSGSAAQTQRENGADDESEFYDGQEDFYD